MIVLHFYTASKLEPGEIVPIHQLLNQINPLDELEPGEIRPNYVVSQKVEHLAFRRSTGRKSAFTLWNIPGEKPLEAEEKTDKLNSHVMPSLETERGTHWWERTSAPNTAPSPY